MNAFSTRETASRTVELPYSREEVGAEKARRSLEAFVRESWPVLEPGTPYHSNWHIGAICYHLEAVSAGEIKNLLVNVPPGFLKSLVGSVMWPAWEWIASPHLRYVAAANTLPLAVRDTKRMRDLVASEWYQRHYGSSFRLEADQNQKLRFQNDHKGYRVAKGVGSGTGERGDRVIFDDPHELDDAESPEALRASVSYNNVTLDSRRADPERSAKVVIQQRVSVGDVSDDILRKMEEGGRRYEVLCLPMRHDPEYQLFVSSRNVLGWKDPRTEPGELLDPERYGPEALAEDEITYGERATAILDQKPREGATTIWKRAWWRDCRYDPADVRIWNRATARYASLDTANKAKTTNAYSCLTIGDLQPEYTLPIRHVARERLEFPDLVEWTVEELGRFKNDRKFRALLIEDAASGTQLIQTLRRSGPEWLRPRIVAIPATSNKEVNWKGASYWSKRGMTPLPEPSDFAEWLADWEREIFDVRNAPHKDQADSYSQLVNYLEREHGVFSTRLRAMRRAVA